jgi:hypothetical protein
MKRKGILVTLLLVILALAIAGAALAQTSTNYNLEWTVLGGGGGPASSSSYAVHSMMGQVPSGADAPSSSSYRVSGGLYGGAGFEYRYQLNLPIVLRGAL